VYEPEWWHFDFAGWEQYDILDVSFEELEQR
jgi:D-alanyl-D-alanine dipeptidase